VTTISQLELGCRLERFLCYQHAGVPFVHINDATDSKERCPVSFESVELRVPAVIASCGRSFLQRRE